MKLNGKVALITGASRGIGAAIASKLASLGCDVAINYAGNIQKAEETLNSVKAYGVNAQIYQANVANYEEVEAMTKQIIKDFGHLDIIINNAGITSDNLMMRMDQDSFDSVIDVNLKGTWNVCKSITRPILKQRSGVIINLSSVVGINGNVGQVNYAASKAGVIGLTKSLAKEFASRNIRVNAVAPGYVKSDMTAKLSEEITEKVLENIPLGQLGEVEDIANAVAFLVSDEARYITGQVLVVDGGMAI
ncbi:3-oxoacyl-[acyl-carrier-protein] reductase [Turicibacter bilis]|uniref:3-oxoacyl-[acyl-carrier-protein] reductase n=1 Tax=Turicibacter bilis TaxID=2735723 RepID=UPI001BAF73EA|nr:3-oxoacyl-[acyl-carrier-protein] reductase [Turicibacter bilis]MBS3203853.1 3-oxoacyl-[acyl-carrier-protein] reductase [Turicibacter bilis]UUF11781.1 3-oxoacyl-[acyl-carrier-protein] reductase [Turicibacter bilis]